MEGIQGIAVVLGILLALNLVATLLKNSNKKNNTKIKKYPYKPKYMLTKNEYAFYKELQDIAQKMNWIICPKVGLKELFDVTDKQNYMKYFSMISQKHVDFIICKQDLKPLYAIELDDNSHQNRKGSDEFKNEIFKLSYIKLIRIKACTEYSKEYIMRNILAITNDNNTNCS